MTFFNEYSRDRKDKLREIILQNMYFIIIKIKKTKKKIKK